MLPRLVEVTQIYTDHLAVPAQLVSCRRVLEGLDLIRSTPWFSGKVFESPSSPFSGCHPVNFNWCYILGRQSRDSFNLLYLLKQRIHELTKIWLNAVVNSDALVS